jgi:hypothetical protein
MVKKAAAISVKIFFIILNFIVVVFVSAGKFKDLLFFIIPVVLYLFKADATMPEMM